jgi:glycosyltransferase involved in cell wall biosynthesis
VAGKLCAGRFKLVTPKEIAPDPADDAIPCAPELAEMKRRLAAAENGSRALKEQIRAIDELLQQARERLRSAKRKLTEAEHYRSIVHDLRSRWYLRPFIPGEKLRPPKKGFADYWLYRGPRFDQPSSVRHRVLIVGHLLSGTLFGSEKSLLEIIAAIDPDKFDVFAVFPERNEQVFAALRSQVQGIAVFDYFWWRQDRPFDEEAVSIFEEICRQRAIDLVHVNTIMLRDPLLAARRLGIPGITNARELISQDDELIARLGGDAHEIARIVCENATYLLANSAATLTDYPCGEKGGFLYNSFNAKALDLPQRVDPSHICVGLVSSNILKKGVLDFLELAREAEKQLPALQFHLIGPDSFLTRQWREGAQKLPANFHLRGHIVDPPDAYRDLNVVLNLSRFAESFGRTVAEAMMARRPVIGYHHGALSELIDDGETGFLVPYLDLSAVLDRLRFFVANPAKITEFGETARQRSLALFSRDVFADRIKALYERLIAEARQRC